MKLESLSPFRQLYGLFSVIWVQGQEAQVVREISRVDNLTCLLSSAILCHISIVTSFRTHGRELIGKVKAVMVISTLIRQD